MIGSLVFTIVFNVIVVVSFYLTRVILSKYLSPSGSSLTFDRWPHRVSGLCDFRVISLSFLAIWHVFEGLDHFPKVSDDSPNIIAGWFYERITMFSELISKPCRRRQRRDVPDNREFTKPRRRRREQRGLKNKFIFTYESRDTRKSFTLFITVKTIWKLNAKHSNKYELEILNLVVVAHVLQTTQNLVISRCCFAEDGKEMYQDSKRTCTAIVLLINPFVWWRSLCRCRRGFVNSLVFILTRRQQIKLKVR